MKNTLLDSWNSLQRIPCGKWIYSKLLSLKVPYSGNTNPKIIHLEPGHCTVQLNDRRAVRNHLRSIHAIALANIGELASGLALNTAVPDTHKCIVTNISIDYIKKARGTLTASSKIALPEWNDNLTLLVESIVTDPSNDPVAKIKVTWKINKKTPH